MIKKYIPFFALQLVAFGLWAWWALPTMNEQGSLTETLEWSGVQTLIVVLLILLLWRGKRYSRWLTAFYACLVGLFGYGTLGWALMGSATPLSVYVVALIFIMDGLALLFCSLKDLNIGRERREIHYED